MLDRRKLRCFVHLYEWIAIGNLGKYGKQELRGAGKRKNKDRMGRAYGEVDCGKEGRPCRRRLGWRRTGRCSGNG
jgi:hypothetical protein